jgi:broad specificity phosphatase PhoE
MRLFFVRHGESVANQLGIISNRGLPHPLTPLGRQQAASLAQQLSGAGVSAVYTSPVPRAVQTAEIVAGACGLPSVTSDALREFDCGELEGRADKEAWAAHRRVMEAWSVEGNLEARTPGGESFVDMRERFVPFVAGLLSSAGEAPNDQGLVLVSHGAVLRLMLPLVAANLPGDFMRAHPLPHASPVVLEARPGRVVCVAWAGTPVPL